MQFQPASAEIRYQMESLERNMSTEMSRVSQSVEVILQEMKRFQQQQDQQKAGNDRIGSLSYDQQIQS